MRNSQSISRLHLAVDNIPDSLKTLLAWLLRTIMLNAKHCMLSILKQPFECPRLMTAPRLYLMQRKLNSVVVVVFDDVLMHHFTSCCGAAGSGIQWVGVHEPPGIKNPLL